MVLVEKAQVVEARRYKGIVRAFGLLCYCQRSLVEGLRRVVVASSLVEIAQDVEECCHKGIVRAENFLPYCQRSLVEGLRGGEVA